MYIPSISIANDFVNMLFGKEVLQMRNCSEQRLIEVLSTISIVSGRMAKQLCRMLKLKNGG